MGNTLARVLPLALGAAVSPTVLIVMLVVLSGPNRPRARGAMLALGGCIVLLGLTALGLTLLGHGVTNRSASNPLYAWIDIGFGVLLLLAGIRALVAAPEPSKPPAEDGGDGPARLGRFFGLGVVVMLTNVTTIALYLPAMKVVAVSGLSAADQAVILGIALAITGVALWVPLLPDVLAPRTADRVLGGMHRFMTVHQRAITVVVCFGFAAYLGLKGARAL